MDENQRGNEGNNMMTLRQSPAIPAHPNIVEMVALLEDPRLHAATRTALRRELHDTVHLVKKRDNRSRAAHVQYAQASA